MLGLAVPEIAWTSQLPFAEMLTAIRQIGKVIVSARLIYLLLDAGASRSSSLGYARRVAAPRTV